MRLVAVAALLALVGAAAPARAQVALSLSYSADDVVQRDLAGVVTKVARSTWQVVPTPVTGCMANDTACLRTQAHHLGATHVLVVAVATLGVRDHVLAVQLLDVATATPLFDDSALQPGTDPAYQPAGQLAERLGAIVGPPAAVLTPTTASAGPDGTLRYVGAGLVLAGAIVGVTTGLASSQFAAGREPIQAGVASVVGISAAGALIALGCGAFVVDAL